MKKKGGKKPAEKRVVKQGGFAETSLTLHEEILSQKKHLEKILETMRGLEDRAQDLEIHVNLLTRLLTTLCVEKFGMRVGVLKRLIKRIETEAIRDSQISQLESIYKLSEHPQNPPRPPSKKDPWEEIS